MSVELTLIQEIKKVDGKKLYLPNSVSVSDNKIIITDGGNNRVCIIGDNVEYSIGESFGIGKYKFKEPVFSMFLNNKIFVCDWHNHRIVQYENKIFKGQIGIFGNQQDIRIKSILKFIKSLSSNGSFIEKHFDSTIKKKIKISLAPKVKNILNGILFYTISFKLFFNNFIKKTYINKPNGCIHFENKLIFTQKNNKSITVYNLGTCEIIQEINNSIENIDFGRLGQITSFDEKIYVCDETNNTIWIFSKKLNLIEKKSITKYNIFSISINENYIATCGETGFSIFNHEFKLLFEKIGDGEYHGVSLNGNVLYVCNRLKSQIEKYHIGKL